ncbi:MAG: hypothetical protein H8E12_19725 [Rhodobacteraceae bacterium]|nr:hypothetical protein [Paracoccaceae bacterium]
MPVIVKNQDRYRKVYPGTRKAGRGAVSYTTKIEVGEITLTDAFVGTYTFTNAFSKIPSVTISVVGAAGNVNVFITSVSTTSVSIETSAAITGKINVQIIEV